MRDMLKIQEYGLANFSKVLQEAVRAGWSLDLDVNDGVPQAYGSFFECELYRTDTDTSVVPVTTSVVADNTSSDKSDEPVSDVLTVIVTPADKVPEPVVPSRGRPKRT